MARRDPPQPGEDMAARNAPENHGLGTHLLYTRYSALQALVDLLNAWKWPIIVLLGSIAGVLLLGWVTIPDVPAEVWSVAFYALLGVIPAIIPSYLLYRYFRTVEGTEVWDMDPITGRHRHLRLGTEMWDDLVVRSPWGEVVGQDELADCHINGRSGKEMMDFRIEPDETPVCVATWIGEGSGAEFRTYKKAYAYAHKRLARRADRATMLRSNQGEIAREAAERVVMQMVVTAERSSIPAGGEVDAVVTEVLDDFGLGSPLDDDIDDARQPKTDGEDPDDSDGRGLLDMLEGDL